MRGYSVGFETYTADADLSPLFVGLPNDRCQCTHWGYVVKGKLTFKTADGDETFEAGDAKYVGLGHTPMLYAGTEVVEFSPTKELEDHSRSGREEHGVGGLTTMTRSDVERVRDCGGTSGARTTS